MTAMTTTWKPSEAQVSFMRTLVNERVSADKVNDFWQYNVKTIHSQRVFSDTVEMLKARPKVNVAPVTPVVVPPVLPALATEEGLYRDPATGTLYRLSYTKVKHSWETPSPIVSEYSNKVLVRRLTTDGEKVLRGTWNRYKAYETNRAIRYNYREVKGLSPVTGVKILADWKMTEQDKQDYQYGICLFCMRGLSDGESVRRNYGPDCAKNYGLPYDHSRKGLKKVQG